METTETTANPAAAYEVPDEPGVYWCPRHKGVKTRLRCGRCEKPICPKCTVMGWTGARCKDCASNRSQHIYQVSPTQYSLAFAVAAGLGAVGAFLVMHLGLLVVFFAALVGGTLLGKVVHLATGGKRGVTLAIVTSIGALAGGAIAGAMVLVPIFVAAGTLPSGAPGAVEDPGDAIMKLVLLLAYLGLIVPSMWWWIK